MELLLKKYFGYEEFRSLQLEVITNVLEKKDTLVLMPTGGGKSLCYQIPALKFEGLTIVISPLISLMKDQVDALKVNGVSAEYINSTLTPKVIEDIKTRIERREVKILYIAPERLSSDEFKSFLLGVEISLIAIDEAHCISEWGHDFRKDYRNLKFLKKIFVGVPIIALTATATQKVKEDILKQLDLDNPKVFVSSFDRDNLNLIVMKKKDTFDKILDLVDKHKNESVIIYCFSRKDTESLTKKLNGYGMKALAYHAGLSSKIRKQNQELFIKDKVDIMVATIAFGMGIDKPDVRLVIHHTYSKSVEGYYQEIGRAGRDGLPSDCVMFYSRGDSMKHEFFVNMIEDISLKRGALEKLSEMMFYCERKSCRRKYLLEYFGEEFPKHNCNGCDVCLELPGVEEITSSRSFINKKVSYDCILFEELRDFRKKVAEDRGLAPSVVFGDVALREMATTFPRSEEDFMKVNGVGQQKLNDFGEDFLILINDYVMQNEVLERISATNVESDDEVVRRFSKTKKVRKTKRGGKAKKKATSDSPLFEKLKVLRKNIADKRNVPAFMIFSDTSLVEMTKKSPKSDKEFLDVKGVGPKKLNDFGGEFLMTINSHVNLK
ncbi:MAG: ATP-dependent DNA helicase [Candidatus Woesearchaeota archaeon]|jgi:ATP-dependent DNA helicase RecQ|nr:ATP-dependent DNA helicase [Candidatus Woesearchaeota archaeon]